MDYDNKTREDLIEIIEKFRKKFEDIKIHLENTQIRIEGMNHPDPELEPVGKYTCECGCQILIRNRKRHEASARHIRGIVQIRE